MKTFARIARYNWKYFTLAICVFVVFWHILSVRGAVLTGEDKFYTALSQKVVDLESSFLSNDLVAFQKNLWQLKNENIKNVKFFAIQDPGISWRFKEVVVGGLTAPSMWLITNKVNVVSNGAYFGNIEFSIDLRDINAAVFKNNFLLFLTMIFFFTGLLTFSSLGAVKAILNLEHCVVETNRLVDSDNRSAAHKAIQENLSALPSSLRGTPFSDLIGRLANVLQRAARLESELAVSKATSDMAAQVAHDIRSPLAALGAAAKGLSLPEEQRTLIDGAIGRMQGIADDLLQRYRAPGAAAGAKVETHALAGLIEQVIAEKRLQHKDKPGVKINFEDAARGAKAAVDAKELQRIVSNLLNNSVEAFAGAGSVAVRLAAEDGRVLLAITDDGKGIPPEVLAKLGQKGETHGKAGGTGLGLYHARTSVENWGGSLKIESEPGKGTAVTLTLPAAARPAAGLRAALLDDDALVHMNWRMAAKAAGAELQSFKTPQEFAAAAETLPRDIPLFIDSELGEGVKGEDIAVDLHTRGFSDITMATGHSAEKFSHLPWLKVAGKEPPWG